MVTGIIPCAGSATRMNGIPKFLLPIDDEGFHLLGRWIRLMKESVDHLIVATSPLFYEIVSAQLEKDVEIKSLTTATMCETLLKAIDDNSDDYVMCMPDTYVPDDSNCINQLVKSLDNTKFVGALRLYEIREDQKGKLGQCEIDSKGIIKDIIDKNPDCNYQFAWGLAAWKKEFNQYILEKDPHVGYSFRNAIKDNLEIGASFGTGSYFDCGTFLEYRKVIARDHN